MKWLLFLAFTFSFWNAQAHQADISSTMLVERDDSTWILQVRGSLTAFEYEINTNFGEDAYATPEKFQELVIEHISNNISIDFNQHRKASINNGVVKLGHETNAIFEINNVPENFKNISVTNTSFSDIHKNKSALIVLKKGFEKEQFVLSNDNNHKANLTTNGTKFIMVAEARSQPLFWQSFSIIVGLGIILLITFYVKKRV